MLSNSTFVTYQYLHVIQVITKSGFTQGLQKCQFYKPTVKYLGQIIGSGERRIDPSNAEALLRLREPESKKQLRSILGLFAFLKEYVRYYMMHAKGFTDLTSKRIPDRIPFVS